MKYITRLLIALLLFAPLAIAKTGRPVFLYDIRSQAMGGAGITKPTGSFRYIYNPAILAQKKFDLSLLGLKIDLSEGFLNVVDYLRDNSENFKKLGKDSTNISVDEKNLIMHELRTEATSLDNIWFKPVASPLIGATIQNFGFGIYNVARIGLKLDVGIIDPSIKAFAQDDLVFAFGFGKQLNENLSLGFGAKFIRRFESSTVDISIEKTEGMEETIDASFDKLKKGITGFGFDVGGIFQFSEKIQVAAVAQDLLSRIGADYIPMNLKLGMAYQYTEHLQLAADVVDLFNRNSERFINKFHLGVEYCLPVISVQAGFNQGYPTIGLGLDLWVFRFNYAYFTAELTGRPGQQPEYYHLLGIEIGSFFHR